MAVDRLSMQFYSSIHPRRPHVQGNQFDLGNPGLMENLLPTFWSESLSRVFGGASVSISGDHGTEAKHVKGNGTNNLRPGKRTPTEEKREKARQMRAGGHSYGEIADALGISRSYAHKLVNKSV